jgi:MATE family multidrug resistance protein
MPFQKYIPHIKPSFRLAYPVMLSQLGHVMMGVTDSIMVGHVGAESLAAASLANVVFNVLLLFGIGVSYAMTPIIASAQGDHNDHHITETLKHGLIINFTNSIMLVGIVILAKNLLYHINQPKEVVALALPYLSITTFSLIPALLFQTFRQFSEALSHTRLPMVVTIIGNLLNLFLCYVLIYGHLGFPAMGLLGAGWATLVSRLFMASGMASVIFYSTRFKHYREGFTIGNYSGKLLTTMLHIGLPAGVQFIFEAAAFDFSAVMMGWLGAKTLAAHQIALNLATISYMTTSGLAAAATIRVSNERGKNDIATLRTVAYTLLLMAMAFMAVWAIIFIAGRNVLPFLYVDDLEVIAIASPLIIIAGFFQLSDGAQVVCAGALRGLQDVKVPSFFIFIAYWIIGLPLGYWLGFKMNFGANGIWMGLLIGLTLTATAMFVRFKSLSKKLLVNAVA